MRLEDAAKYAQITVHPQRQKGVIHISAGGPGSGRHKGLEGTPFATNTSPEQIRSLNDFGGAHKLSSQAYTATSNAVQKSRDSDALPFPDKKASAAAMRAHDKAADLHDKAALAHLAIGNKELASQHTAAAEEHSRISAKHEIGGHSGLPSLTAGGPGSGRKPGLGDRLRETMQRSQNRIAKEGSALKEAIRQHGEKIADKASPKPLVPEHESGTDPAFRQRDDDPFDSNDRDRF